MNLDCQTIYGCQLGFEIADEETKEELEMNWGVTVDLMFFRFVLTSYKE